MADDTFHYRTDLDDFLSLISVDGHTGDISEAEIFNRLGLQRLLERYNAEKLLSNIRGIPHLIQAVQCSLEVSLAQSSGFHYQFSCGNDGRSNHVYRHGGNPHNTDFRHSESGEEEDSAIVCRENGGISADQGLRFWHGLPSAALIHSSIKSSTKLRKSKSDDKLHFDQSKKLNKTYCECCERSKTKESAVLQPLCADHLFERCWNKQHFTITLYLDAERRHIATQLALKRQSVFVIFPYSETVPMVSSANKTKTTASTTSTNRRRSSSAECFKKLCQTSKDSKNVASLKNGYLCRSSKIEDQNSCMKMMCESCSGDGFDIVPQRKEAPGYRRPSFEVRLIGIHHPNVALAYPL
uniref:Uncharacterized protein n=1 Tax=Romanomermis culicivorax TaxID=13658 RepID=A0A915I941_ROMCU